MRQIFNFKLFITALIISGLALIAMRIPFVESLFRKPLPPSEDTPSSSDIENQARLLEEMSARILFDSNRSGSFGIYSMKPDGSDVQTIVDTEKQEIYPDPSPDGEWVVFARAETTARKSKSDIWIIRHNGKDSKLIAKDGTFPTFSSDGSTVYFERGRNKLISVDVSSLEQKELFPKNHPEFGRHGVIKPRVSSDGKFAAFISDKKGRWNTWYVNLETSELSHLAEGCEPSWFAKSGKIAWIKTSNTNERSGLYKFNPKSKKVKVLQDEGPPRGHEYFPTVSPDEKFLLYSSCRVNEHSHITANYQIFVKNLETERLTRVTFDQHNNRWPKVLPIKN